MTGAEHVIRALEKRGVSKVFGYSGGAVLPLLDVVSKTPSVEFYVGSNEQCSGHAAIGLAKASGQTAVVLTTSGPGMTNLITPMQDALGDGVPVVFITAQVARTAMGTDAFQECDATRVSGGATKWNYVCLDPSRLPWAINECFRKATTGRPGPVHLDVPKDIMNMDHPVFDKFVVDSPENQPIAEDSALAKQLSEAWNLLGQAQRPLLWVGQGALDSWPAVRQLMETLKLPTVTTIHGMGIVDEGHPLSLKMVGMHGSVAANRAAQEADLIINVGARFDDRTTGAVPTFAPQARQAEAEGRGGILHFEIRPSEVGRVVAPTVALVGPLNQTLAAFMDGISGVPPALQEKRNTWVAQCQATKSEHPFTYDSSIGLTGQECLHKMDLYLKKQDLYSKLIVATGVGNHQMFAAQFLEWKYPRRFLTSGSLGVMGAGLPYIVGSALGDSNASGIHLLIDGDGSFGMTLTELQTVKRYRLPVKLVVLNDEAQQMVRVWQTLFFEGRIYGTENQNCLPDFKHLAQAFDLHFLSCATSDDVESTVEKLFSCEGPVLCEFKVQPDICLPMVAPGKSLSEMFLPKDRATLLGTRMEGDAPN